MRVAWITPNLPPRPCGVGDYGAKVIGALKEAAHEVLPLDGRNFLQIFAQCRSASPDRIFLNFTPYLYGAKTYGLSPGLLGLLLMLRLRFGRNRLDVIAHELHYPVQWADHGWVLGPLQLFQWIVVAILAGRLHFTYQVAWTNWRRFLFYKRKRMFW